MLHLSGSGQACEGLQQEWSILNSEGIEMGHMVVMMMIPRFCIL